MGRDCFKWGMMGINGGMNGGGMGKTGDEWG